jgi:hypothetical protein
LGPGPAGALGGRREGDLLKFQEAILPQKTFGGLSVAIRSP